MQVKVKGLRGLMACAVLFGGSILWLGGLVYFGNLLPVDFMLLSFSYVCVICLWPDSIIISFATVHIFLREYFAGFEIVSVQEHTHLCICGLFYFLFLSLQAFGAPYIVAHVNGKKEIFFGSDRFPVMALIIGEYKARTPGGIFLLRLVLPF